MKWWWQKEDDDPAGLQAADRMLEEVDRLGRSVATVRRLIEEKRARDA